jgi:hypothetical protein
MIAPYKLVEDRDRKLTEKEIQLGLSLRPSVHGRSPREKFLKTEKPISSPRQQTAQTNTQRASAALPSFVSVQEPTNFRETAFKGDKFENFKSPSLFWEIRLKESQVSAEKVVRPTASSIIEICDVLSEYSNRLSSQGDSIFPSIKEQVPCNDDATPKPARSHQQGPADILRSLCGLLRQGSCRLRQLHGHAAAVRPLRHRRAATALGQANLGTEGAGAGAGARTTRRSRVVHFKSDAVQTVGQTGRSPTSTPAAIRPNEVAVFVRVGGSLEMKDAVGT